MDNKALTYNTNIVDWSNPVTKGLVGAFRLNEGAGKMAFDATRFTLAPGTLTNDAVYKVSRLGAGCSFDGTTDYIGFGNGNFKGFNGATVCTASIEVMFNTFAPSFQVMLSSWNSSVTEMKWHLFCDNLGRVYFQLTSSGGGSIYIYSNTVMSINTKYIITATWNGTTNTVALFFNSVKDTSTTVTSGTPPTSITTASNTEFRISTAQNNSGANTFAVNGYIKEVLLWNREISQNEARQLYIDSNNIYL